MRGALVLALLGAGFGASPGAAQDAACPAPPLHPAYAHNDYLNRRPLLDALERGLRGVEADLFLVHGRLLVAHDRRDARPDRTLESLYLQPLDRLVSRCGRILPDGTAFLLTVELKQPSRAAFDSLLAVLARHPGLFDDGAAEVVLVGWHPAPALLAGTLPGHVRLQAVLTSAMAPPAAVVPDLVRLVSLDFGHTVGWTGRGPPPPELDAWLAALARAKAPGLRRITRVYNLPAVPALHARLIAAGVDLIGIKRLDDPPPAQGPTTR